MHNKHCPVISVIVSWEPLLCGAGLGAGDDLNMDSSQREQCGDFSDLVPASFTALAKHGLRGKGCMQPSRKWTVISLETRLAFQEAALVRDPEVGCGMGQNSAERLKEEWSRRRVALPVLDAQVSEGFVVEAGIS